MRVTLLVGGYPTPDRPDRGIFNQRAAAQLAERVDLQVVFLRAWTPHRPWLMQLQNEPFPVVQACVPRLKGPLAWNLGLARIFGRLLLRHRLEGRMVLHSVGADTAGVPASFLASSLGIPHVAQFTGTDINLSLPPIRHHPCISGWERGVSAAVCNSQGLVEQLRSIYPGIRHVHRVYRGTDLDRFHPLSRPPTREGDAPLAVFFGGLPPSGPDSGIGQDLKGGLTLMEAWRLLETAEGPGLRLLFAGPGADCDRTQAWRAALQHPERVEILGAQHPDSLKTLLQQADLLLLPSRHEGLPNLAVEAIACGTPVLASDIPGAREVVLPGQSGWLAPPADPRAWCEALKATVREIRSGQDMRISARALACERFDYRQWASQVIEIYREILSSADAGAVRDGHATARSNRMGK